MKVERLIVCPRCGGNMLLESDIYGLWEECIQCSNSRQLTDFTFKYQNKAQEDIEPALIKSR